MKCTNGKCPFAESSYLHKECYEKLEANLTEVLHQTGRASQSCGIDGQLFSGPGRGWSRKVCRINLWMRGLPYLQRFLRCRCAKGQLVLDRDDC